MIKKLLLPLLLLIPINANAEVTVSKTGMQYTCTVDIWKEIYNDHFDYWMENRPGNWKANPYSGMSNSDWHKTRMCLQVVIKEMAKTSNTKTVTTYVPGEYEFGLKLTIGENVSVHHKYHTPSYAGTGGIIVEVYSMDPNIMSDNPTSANHCETFYITNDINNSFSNGNPHIDFGEHGSGFHWTSGCGLNGYYFRFYEENGTEIFYPNGGN